MRKTAKNPVSRLDLIEKIDKMYAHQAAINEVVFKETQRDSVAENIRLFHECQSQMLGIISMKADLLRNP